MKLTQRQRKKLVAALVALALLAIGAISEHYHVKLPLENQVAQNNVVSSGFYKVVKFDDGDTIVVDMNGTKETVRFIGVDTPEVKDPRKPVQCFGHAASAFTKQLIGDHPVRLEADPDNTNRDRYNRLLRYIYLPDGTLVNAEIIKQGYGFAYTSFPFTKKAEFKNYENEARQNNKGLWGSCETGKDERGYNTINPESNP